MPRSKSLGFTKPPNTKKPLKGKVPPNPQSLPEEHVEEDPYYIPALQAERYAKYEKRKLLPFRFADIVWLVGEGFQFPRLLERQGLNNFMELQGIIYPNLVREFYANFQFKDDICMSMIKGKKFEMNKDLFREVGNLVCDGVRISDCSSKAWRNFDATDYYISCLRNPDDYVRGTTKKAGLMFVEDRILHYLIAYILVPRLTNYAQPTSKDLQILYAIKKGYKVDWPAEILRTMYSIVDNKEKPQQLAFGIFISRIVDYLKIDTSREVVTHATLKDHLIDGGTLHHMQMYKNKFGEWIYEDEEMEDAGLPDSGNGEDSVDEDHGDGQGPNEATSSAPAFGLAHLDAMEQRFNERIDLRFQEVKDLVIQQDTRNQERENRFFARMDAMESNFMEALRLQTDELKAEYTFASSLFTDQNPSSSHDPPQNP